MDLATLRSQIGRSYPPGEWLQVNQEMIQQFSDLTGDRQWIHLDENAGESSFGSAIAHGLLVILKR